jgi:RNA-binding protein YlmH
MDKGQKEQEYFAARIRNLFALCERQGAPKFSFFLNEAQLDTALTIARGQSLPMLAYGGYDGAERMMLGVFPEWMEPDPAVFPIAGFTLCYSGLNTLGHRDVLGALMAQQIGRETIGDILIESSRVYLFTEEKVRKVVETQLLQIGRAGITVQPGIPENFSVSRPVKEIRGTLASLRLDAAVALLTGLSREKASRLIVSGLTQLNYLPKDNVSAPLSEGDIVTVRGYGKFRLEEVAGLTRKGRLSVRFSTPGK